MHASGRAAASSSTRRTRRRAVFIAAVVVQACVAVPAIAWLAGHGPPRIGPGLTDTFASHLALQSLVLPLIAEGFPVLFSLATGERPSARTLDALMDAVPSMLLATPLFAFGLQLCFEGRLGHLYYAFDRPWPVMAAQALAYLLLSDLAFYLTHRVLHTRPFYRLHAAHHAHHAPTESATVLALSIGELLIEGLSLFFGPLLFVPINAAIFYASALFVLVMGCYIHNGTVRRPALGLLNSPREHQEHHRRGRENANFSLVFTLWDRVFGTHAPPRAPSKAA